MGILVNEYAWTKTLVLPAVNPDDGLGAAALGREANLDRREGLGPLGRCLPGQVLARNRGDKEEQQKKTGQVAFHRFPFLVGVVTGSRLLRSSESQSDKHCEKCGSPSCRGQWPGWPAPRR